MSPRITVQSGIAAGTSHRIENRVARIGSNPQSDVCLPTADIPGHALTLEFRDDGCLVYNRCRESVYIGARVVAPEQVVEWPETDILQLGHGIELLLDLDDSDSDDFCNGMVDEEESELDVKSKGPVSDVSELRQTKTSSGKTKAMIQLLVTVLCLVGGVLLLVRDQNRSAGPEPGPGFSELVSTAIATPGISPELIRRIQYAEAQRIRGRLEIASEEFQSIRNDLIAGREPAGHISEHRNSQILHFIESRVRQMPMTTN